MGCAPTARSRSLHPAGNNPEGGGGSAMVSGLYKDIADGKLSRQNYDKLLRMDI